ncbi:ABC transporter permease [Paenibacillus oenotherae]|uniref:ABC transporter permease n=1 Tax=Paenibacillus oenotherae TaxID=1435645 RepID=A0ABS7D062_9BACL|nr:ABC transporter permease [Paenibacillus oenotherae]MBW7473203.1 ABC transporter permease [Paenibacillus oenotherae]
MSQIQAGGGLRHWRSKLINPVLDKEFRLRMRTSRAMWALFFYLFVIGAMTFGFIYIMTVMPSGSSNSFDPSQSRLMFYFICVVQLGLVAFMAPGLTAGVISGEREKQTLNLLLTTQQSSTTIILSKLFSSLSFMLLLVISTLPVYSVVFLYGGISPKQLLLVFLFFTFVMVVLGSLGILFSTLFKRTMVSVIVTYGATLFIFAGTGFLYLLMSQVMEMTQRNSGTGYNPADYGWIGHIAAWNPVAAMFSIFDDSITEQVFMTRGGSTPPPIALWQEFLLFYSAVAIIAIVMAIRYIRPRYKRSGNGKG